MPQRRLLLTALIALLACPLPAAVAQTSAPSAALARILKNTLRTKAGVASARRLLQQGASYQTQSSRGITVLMLAAQAGDVPMLKAALRAGVDVNARTRDGLDLTALSLAMASRSNEKVRLLLDAGAGVDAADSYGRTPLMLAAYFKFPGGVNLLVARGARLNARNKKGHTALAYADGDPGITRLLQRHGLAE